MRKCQKIPDTSIITDTHHHSHPATCINYDTLALLSETILSTYSLKDLASNMIPATQPMH